MSLHDHPHGYSASALADADAADALAAWRSSHNDNNNDASSSANEDNEDEEEEEVSSTAKGSAGTVKLRGGDAFGVLLPPVQAQADASCVKAERAYVEAAAAAAGGRDVVCLCITYHFGSQDIFFRISDDLAHVEMIDLQATSNMYE